ncbi:hypothetical protein CARUB_v10005751mg [Capsella rubella]|uniref:Senescence regulator S40 n=1 Tax=Capsella rubella TaxID=81985 RepID=R0F6J4_9BRAS|nr:uncharacterized protein LOC17880980 [Capsella rubella]EOA17437.1 hypothetical protein CARUB_v10005751mg [Capsella rubella]
MYLFFNPTPLVSLSSFLFSKFQATLLHLTHILLYKSRCIIIFSKPSINQTKGEGTMERNDMRHEVWSSWRDDDFQEDDVWDVLDDGYQSSFVISNHTAKPSFTTQNLLPSEPRMIPERQRIEGMAPMTQHSAPVNVPDWSMVHTKKTNKKVDDSDDDNVSPEEYFMGRSRSSSSSVMEGVGRKLKGRDLSKVRNAILKQTGFLE